MIFLGISNGCGIKRERQSRKLEKKGEGSVFLPGPPLLVLEQNSEKEQQKLVEEMNAGQ